MIKIPRFRQIYVSFAVEELLNVGLNPQELDNLTLLFELDEDLRLEVLRVNILDLLQHLTDSRLVGTKN